MINPKLSIDTSRNALLGFGLAFFVNFEGILAKGFGLSLKAGVLNQLYAPFFLVILGCSFAVLYYMRAQVEQKEVSILFISTFLLSCLLIATSIRHFEVNKVFRDLTYVWLIFLIFQLAKWKDIRKRFLDIFFIRGFTISFLFVFPLTNWIYTLGTVNRFSGWVLSKPQFANMVLLTGCIYLVSTRKKILKHLVAIISFVLLISSGTRTTTLIFLLFYLYYFLIYKSSEGLKRITWFLGVFLSLSVALFFYFYSQIQTLIEVAGEFRAFSIDDGGSIVSRFTWYSKVFQSLLDRNIIGGFGAGASERLLGLLTHFDFLRFWYDYTIVFSLVFMWNLSFIYFLKRRYRNSFKKVIDGGIFVIIIFTLMGHNVFQSFTMVIMIMLFLIISPDSANNGLSSRFYRVSVASSTSSC